MIHKHFTILERESIFEFLTLGFSKAEIARKLKKHRSNIGREIKRNTINGKYSPHQAEEKYKFKKKCGAKKKLENNILFGLYPRQARKRMDSRTNSWKI